MDKEDSPLSKRDAHQMSHGPVPSQDGYGNNTKVSSNLLVCKGSIEPHVPAGAMVSVLHFD